MQPFQFLILAPAILAAADQYYTPTAGAGMTLTTLTEGTQAVATYEVPTSGQYTPTAGDGFYLTTLTNDGTAAATYPVPSGVSYSDHGTSAASDSIMTTVTSSHGSSQTSGSSTSGSTASAQSTGGVAATAIPVAVGGLMGAGAAVLAML